MIDELRAKLWGLNLAWNIGHKYVICESYSLAAINMVKNRVHSSHPFAPMVDAIKY